MLLRKFLKACFFIFVDLQCWLLSCFARRRRSRGIEVSSHHQDRHRMCSCVGALEEDIHTPAHSSGQYWGDGSLRRNDKAKLVYVRDGTSHLLADSWPHCATWPSLSSSLWLSRHEPRATERTNRFLAWTCVDVSVGAAALYRCMSGCRRTPLGHGTEILWGFSLQSSNSLCFNPFQSVRRSRRATYTT